MIKLDKCFQNEFGVRYRVLKACQIALVRISDISFLNKLSTRRFTLEAFFIALVLIVAIFPDVIFLKASLRLTDQIAGPLLGVHLRPFYPLANHIGWWAGYNDNGGAISQSEPMIEFMRYCLVNWESPYWNPFSAAGSLGPETLVDQKFSAFTLVNAALGGSSFVYNATILLFYYFAVFFLYRTSRQLLGLSVLASVGTALFYMLNGYSVANFGSNVTQSYLYVPMCLYVSLSFLEKPTTGKFVAIIFSFAVYLSCTFAPTTVTSFIAMYAIILGFVWAKINRRELNYRSGAALVILQGSGVIAAIFLLAVLYLPILENIKSTGTLEDYSNRIFFALKFPQAIASLFSPTHLYESYNAMEAGVISWRDPSSKYNGIIGNTIFHFGITAIALTGCALSFNFHRYNRLKIICALTVSLAFLRLFEPPMIAELMSHIPIVGKIGCQYWWPVVMIPTIFLIGFGIDNLDRHVAKIWPALILLIIGVAATYHVYKIYGFGEPAIDFKLAALILLSVLATIVIFLLLTLRFGTSAFLTKKLVFGLVALMFIELMLDSKMVRFKRNDFFTNPSDAIAYVRNNVGLYRTLNFGQSGLYQELGPALQIQEITSRNQGVLTSYLDYFYAAIDLDNTQRSGYNPVVNPRGVAPVLELIKDKPSSNSFNWPALDLLGVKYVFLPANFPAYKAELIRQGLHLVYETSDTLVFENPNVLPRAFALESPTAKVEPAFTLPADFRKYIQPATIASYRNTAVEIRGTASAEMLVVISDNWHQNWHATLNDNEVPIIKVNGALRGIAVPKGEYVIKMNYQPRTLPLAIGISSGVLSLMVILLFCRKYFDKLIQRQRLIEA